MCSGSGLLRLSSDQSFNHANVHMALVLFDTELLVISPPIRCRVGEVLDTHRHVPAPFHYGDLWACGARNDGERHLSYRERRGLV